MNIVFWGKGERGLACYKFLKDRGYNFPLIICQKKDRKDPLNNYLEMIKQEYITPNNINDTYFLKKISSTNPDLFILCGYGRILKRRHLEIPRIGSINLHAGKIPDFKGSSPLNWALIKDKKSFTLSIIEVDTGIDTGGVIAESTFPIDIHDTINNLHSIANEQFPQMLEQALCTIKKNNSINSIKRKGGSYYPLRFPEDGLIIWDLMTAKEVHNKIRALTKPYPCAFSYINGKKILLIKAELLKSSFFGEPGRIYKIFKDDSFLVAAKDMCLKIKEYESEEGCKPTVERYKQFLCFRNQITFL